MPVPRAVLYIAFTRLSRTHFAVTQYAAYAAQRLHSLYNYLPLFASSRRSCRLCVARTRSHQLALVASLSRVIARCHCAPAAALVCSVMMVNDVVKAVEKLMFSGRGDSGGKMG